MAKQKKTNIVKRITAKSGQIYYFKNGKRISEKKGASEFVKTFFSQIDPAKLSPKEAQSYRGKLAAQQGKAKLKKEASGRLRFKGRFVPTYLQRLLIEQKLIDPKETEIRREFTEVKSFGDFLKEIKDLVPKTAFLRQSEWALPSQKRERTTFESVIDIADTINTDPLFSTLELNVITPKGDVITNRIKALEAARDWEIERIEQIQQEGGNPAYTRFSHYGNINVENGTLTIDLNDSDEDTNFS
jgi:hypothetical protein